MQFIDLKAQYAAYRSDIDRRMAAVLDHGRYIMGPEVAEMERALATRTGVAHCVSCASGTDALFLALLALDLQPGDEVITTPFTFIATAEIISLLHGVPVFVDIDPVTYTIDPAHIEAAITERTKAILPVSLFGQAPEIEVINRIARRNGVAVIEDGAQSLGATRFGDESCGLSDFGVTSFFPSKPLGCFGDGGALFTDDDELAQICRELRAHGQTERYVHNRIGTNARMDTLQAAVVLGKLEHFDDEVAARARIGARYTAALSDLVTTPAVAEGNTHVYAQYSIQVDDRAAFVEALKAQGIPTAVHYPVPLHRQKAFAPLGYSVGDFPISEAVAERIVSLPMGPFLSDDDQNRVIAAVLRAVVG